MQCYEPTCARSFHVGCARASDEQFYIAINDNCEPVAMCPRHVPEEFKRPKVPKGRKGRGKDQAEPIKKISLREVLTDPILVGLENKVKEIEDAKRNESQILGEKMMQRMRDNDARRLRQRERLQAAMVRVQKEQAERLADVHAASTRAANAAAPLTAPVAGMCVCVCVNVPCPCLYACVLVSEGVSEYLCVYIGSAPSQNGPGQPAAEAQRGSGAAGGVGSSGTTDGATGTGAMAAHPYSVAHAHAHATMMHPGMHQQPGYSSSFAGIMGQPGMDFPYLPPLPPATAALLNEEERRRDGYRMARSAEEQRKEAELRNQEHREEQEEGREIIRHEQRIKDLREEERKTREEYLETKRRMREHKRQLERDAKQAKRDAAQAKRDEAEALRLAKDQKKQMRDMLQSGRLSVLDREAGARQALGDAAQAGAVAELPEQPLPVKPPNAFAIFRTRVTETVKAEVASRHAEDGASEVSFSTEIAQRWQNLAVEEKDVYMQEASKLMAEYQQELDRRVSEEQARRQQISSVSLHGAKRSRTQTEFLSLGDSGASGTAGPRLDDAILKRARTLQQQKRRLTRSWKAMVLQAVLALAPDYSTAAPLEEVVRKIGQLHPTFASKAEGKTKMLLDDLVKDNYVHVWCPSDVIELDEEDIELQDPNEDSASARDCAPIMAKLAGAEGGTYWGAAEDWGGGEGGGGGGGGERGSFGDAAGGGDMEDGSMDAGDKDACGGERAGFVGFKSSKKRRSEWEKKAHYYAPADALAKILKSALYIDFE